MKKLSSFFETTRKFLMPGILLLTLALYSFVNIYKMGSLTPTWDERHDYNEVRCCNSDIKDRRYPRIEKDHTQARLPFYLHAFVMHLFEVHFGKSVHHVLSFIFGFLNLALLYWFSRREFGRLVGGLTLILFATSIPLLASSRMILTHSNVIFTTFSLLTIMSSYYFAKHGTLKLGILCGVCFGLAVGSNYLGLSLLLFFVSFSALISKRTLRVQLKHLLIPITVLGIVYLFIAFESPRATGFWMWRLLTMKDYSRPYYNYFNLGLTSAPWWFSLMTFVVKISPWCFILYAYFGFSLLISPRAKDLKERFLLSLMIATLTFLLLKSGHFGYSAPQHQVHWYPLVYLTIAYAIAKLFNRLGPNRLLRIIACCIFAFLFFLQVRDVWRFFPNYLFYGSQYGKSFIGELYGPAVLLCQDIGPIRDKVRKINKTEQVIFLVPNWCCMYGTRNIKSFKNRDRNKHYKYAIWDYLYMNHLRSWGPSNYQAFLQKHCKEIFTHQFPPGYTIYALYECT